MKYNKPALTAEEHVELFKQRGLIISNEEEAIYSLNHIGYYRISAYLYDFRIPNDPNQNFIPGTTLENVLKIYSFDRKLRILVFDAIERFEVAFRTIFSNFMVLKYDPFWNLDVSNFFDLDKYNKNMEEFKFNYDKSKEIFIKSYKKIYTEPVYPPSWISFEILTFGVVVKYFKNLARLSDQKEIATKFGVTHHVFLSWLDSIAHVRNLCAHHSRLWNRILGIYPTIPNLKNDSAQLFQHLVHQDGQNQNYSLRKIYSILSILNYILKIIHRKNSFKNKLQDLFKEYPLIDPIRMGFPVDWELNNIWNL